MYAENLGMLIDGEWIGADERESLTLMNPATGLELAQLPRATTGDLDHALDAAGRAFRTWKRTIRSRAMGNPKPRG